MTVAVAGPAGYGTLAQQPAWLVRYGCGEPRPHVTAIRLVLLINELGGSQRARRDRLKHLYDSRFSRVPAEPGSG